MKILLKLLGAGTLVILACLSIAASSKRHEYRGNPDPDNTQQAIILAHNPSKILLVVNAIAMGGAAIGLFAWVLEDIEPGEASESSQAPFTESSTTASDESHVSQPEHHPVIPQTHSSQSPLPQDLVKHLQQYSTPLSTQQDDSHAAVSDKEVQLSSPSVSEQPLTESELLASIGHPRM